MTEPEYNPWDHMFDDLKPYYESIGRVVVACNRLQFEMGRLFTSVLHDHGRGVWNSLSSDRQQIDMLAAAARDRFGPSTMEGDQYPQILPAVIELVSKAHTQLNARNEYVHSPYTLNLDFKKQLLSLAPDLRMDNKFAVRLATADDILAGMKRFQDHTLDLANYAELMGNWLHPAFGNLSSVKSFSEIERGRKEAKGA